MEEASQLPRVLGEVNSDPEMRLRAREGRTMPKVAKPASGQRGAGAQGQAAPDSRVTLSKSLASPVKIQCLKPACLLPKAMGKAL